MSILSKKNIQVFSLIFIWILGTSSLHAELVKNKNTHKKFDNLQEAINKANPGDILMLEGEFKGSFDIDKSLTLKGNKEDRAILNGKGEGRVLTITGIDAPLSSSIFVTLENLIIKQGKAPEDDNFGGGILVSFANLDLFFTNVKNNEAFRGGGIAGRGSKIKIDKNSEIDSNHATSAGGGIYVSRCQMDILDSHVKENFSDGIGGGILIIESLAAITNNSHINHNKAAFNGGGIDIIDGDLTMANSHLKNNECKNAGGGIYSVDSIIALTEKTEIKQNRATGFLANGGGIYHTKDENEVLDSSLSLNDVEIIENESALFGAGIANYATLAVSNSRILNNSIPSEFFLVEGGGIYNAGLAFIENNSLIQGNAVKAGFGGGISNSGTFSLSIDNSTIKDNEALFGGGIYNTSNMTTKEATIIQNSATANGGGIFNASTIILDDSLINENKASRNGGGIFNANSLFVIHSTINANIADVDGGGILNNNFLSLTDSTITQNTAKRDGGGILNTPGAVMEIDQATEEKTVNNNPNDIVSQL